MSGKVLRTGNGKAWSEVNAVITTMPLVVKSLRVPSMSEPFLAWITSGEVEFQEREPGRPWISHRIKKGMMFLTTGGDPYEVRWKALKPEPFESMAVFLELSLLERALTEVFGKNAPFARLRDASAFEDDVLNALMTLLHGELMRRKASQLLVQSIGQAIAIHLARRYADLDKEPQSESSSLPGHKLRQITDWMKEHMDEDFDLQQLADLAGLSKFHFHRLFKRAVGAAPSHYVMTMRMEEAKRLLRETKESVVMIGLNVGYTSPSHFAQIFRRETGLSPSDYRRQR